MLLNKTAIYFNYLLCNILVKFDIFFFSFILFNFPQYHIPDLSTLQFQNILIYNDNKLFTNKCKKINVTNIFVYSFASLLNTS